MAVISAAAEYQAAVDAIGIPFVGSKRTYGQKVAVTPSLRAGELGELLLQARRSRE